MLLASLLNDNVDADAWEEGMMLMLEDASGGNDVVVVVSLVGMVRVSTMSYQFATSTFCFSRISKA